MTIVMLSIHILSSRTHVVRCSGHQCFPCVMPADHHETFTMRDLVADDVSDGCGATARRPIVAGARAVVTPV